MRNMIHIYKLLVITIFLLSRSQQEKNQHNNTLTTQKSEGESQTAYQFPYILDLTYNEKHLLVYGCYHSFNPDDSIFIDIETRLLDLNPQIVLNEGGDWQVFETKEETIYKSGEQGFVRFLCCKNNIPVKTFEPKPKREFDFILSKYVRDDVLLMYFCRQISQLQNQQQIEDFKKYMIGYLSYLQKNGFPIDDVDKEYDFLINAYEQLFKEKFDWTKFNPENVWPNYDNTILNRINKEISEFRDISILNTIDAELKSNDKMFVIMGGNHLLKQEEKIKKLFK